MDKTLNRIIERLEEYERTHKRVDVGQKRRYLLRDCYERLKNFEEDSLMGVSYDKKSLKIRIVSRQIDSCSQAPAFLILVGLSDICTIYTCRGGFIIDLEFNLWRWVKREDCS